LKRDAGVKTARKAEIKHDGKVVCVFKDKDKEERRAIEHDM